MSTPTLGKLFTHACHCVSSSKQYNLVPARAVIPGGWEGNHCSDVALATPRETLVVLHIGPHVKA